MHIKRVFHPIKCLYRNGSDVNTIHVADIIFITLRIIRSNSFTHRKTRGIPTEYKFQPTKHPFPHRPDRNISIHPQSGNRSLFLPSSEKLKRKVTRSRGVLRSSFFTLTLVCYSGCGWDLLVCSRKCREADFCNEIHNSAGSKCIRATAPLERRFCIKWILNWISERFGFRGSRREKRGRIFIISRLGWNTDLWAVNSGNSTVPTDKYNGFDKPQCNWILNNCAGQS